MDGMFNKIDYSNIHGLICGGYDGVIRKVDVDSTSVSVEKVNDSKHPFL